jgi:uncharacterized membrane protein YgdD (TMEM256/DUF423 family)
LRTSAPRPVANERAALYRPAMPWITVGAALGALGVGLGAFGAHALKQRFGPYEVGIWQTAVLYHLIHALGLFALGLYARATATPAGAAASLFAVGVLLFSGSLYALALSGVRQLGAITPIGGLCFIAGWLWLALRFARA